MIPDYQTLMLPLLKHISDGEVHTTSELLPALAAEFGLTSQDLAELTPTKKHKVFNNRVHWAKAQLKIHGLIDLVHKHTFRITARGLQVLQENPDRITNQFLKEKFKLEKSEISISDNEKNISETQTPEEVIDFGYQKIIQSLEQEILSKLKSVHPSFFEKIVVDLLVKMGYGGSIAEAGKATKYTNDEGIDGIIKEDKLGLDVIYIQAKRWEGTVSRPEIQKFVGALAGQRAKKGVFITTSNFSKEATSYATQMDAKIVLIDGEQLAQYMIDYKVGVSVQNTYEIKKMDSDYFEED
jgi:restriction system protein